MYSANLSVLPCVRLIKSGPLPFRISVGATDSKESSDRDRRENDGDIGRSEGVANIQTLLIDQPLSIDLIDFLPPTDSC